MSINNYTKARDELTFRNEDSDSNEDSEDIDEVEEEDDKDLSEELE